MKFENECAGSKNHSLYSVTITVFCVFLVVVGILGDVECG
jgi:hypothetical protein